jgi:hypothetical protein
MFSRTSAGVGNLYLFYRSDIVVFTEGAGELDQASDMDPQGLFDRWYWSAVLSVALPDTKIAIKSLRDKSECLKMAASLSADETSRVIVCVDADFDWVSGKQFGDDRVVRTWGYSWENDACSFGVVDDIVSSIVPPVGSLRGQCIDEFVRSIHVAEELLKGFIVLDRSQVHCGTAGVFDREREQRGICRHSAAGGFVDCDKIRSRVVHWIADGSAFSVELQPFLRHLFGKFYARLIYHTFVYCVSQYKRIRMEFDHFIGVAIERYGSRLADNGYLRWFFTQQITALAVER